MKTNGTRIFLLRSILFIILLIYFSFVVFAQSSTNSFTVNNLPGLSSGANDVAQATTSSYSFNAVEERLMVTVARDQNRVAPVKSFRGMAVKHGARLVWMMADDYSITSVTLERQDPSGGFASIAEFWLNLEGNSSLIKKDFSFVDKSARKGSNSYRLTIRRFSGEIESSEVIVIRKK